MSESVVNDQNGVLATWQATALFGRHRVQHEVRSGFREALERRGHCRHRALIVESVLDVVGGIQSLPERDFDALRTRLHLPEPSRQTKVKADGRYYLDVEWRAYETACEIHGLPHLQVVQWESDLSRINEITITGPRVLVFSSFAVRRMPARVGDQLVRMLRRGGWRG